jgi:hypothetical protein
MTTTPNCKTAVNIDELLTHIRSRTFDRLHELSVKQISEGRVLVSAIAHSRFVGQLAEWAVLERVAPSDVDLSISVLFPSRRFTEAQK